uniref:Pentatricopeptide repeat-containing protein At4g20770 n=1 Tax=Anthurium amnicola TaxID=1678845 RepID=A0A1D1YW91_9ARAE
MVAFGAKASHFAGLLQACINKRARLPGKIVHAQIVTTGLSPDTFLLNRIVELYATCGSLDDASRVFDTMPSRNVYSWNAIISASCKSGDIVSAYNLLGEMPERNVVSWNTVISALVKDGAEAKALDLYYVMLREGFMPTHFTFASVLSACGVLGNLEHGRRCHGLVVKVGLDGNAFVENALVGMYNKCGDILDATVIFNGMSQPNEVSFTAMMGGLLQDGYIDDALWLFAKMRKKGIQIDAVVVSSALGASARGAEDGEVGRYCKSLKCDGYIFGQQVHVLVIKYGFESDIHVGNSLIDMYAKSGDMCKAQTAFMTLPEVNVVSWNILISGYGQQGDSKKVRDVLQQMQKSGIEPDDVTYVNQLSAYIKSGDIEAAQQMFNNIVNPNLTSWNTIISGYCQKEMYEKAMELFRKMQFLNVHADRTTLAVVLSACSGMGFLQFGKQIHAAATRVMLHSDMFVASGLVDMYSKCGQIEAARWVFDRMPERDVVCWNSMMSGFSLHSWNKEAFHLFQQMRSMGMYPTEYSYASVISSCARLSSLSEGRQIHAQTAKDGSINNIFVGSALIDMYAKCGNVGEAQLFFNFMPRKNIVSWNEIIHGFAQNGCGDMAVELFEDMLRREEKPDSVTFIAILTACSHSGMVDKGLQFFKSMEKDHGIVPLADHYTCIIDALGRAGRFNEIKALIENMPCKDDPIIWEVLLSACRVHANVELGKLAAEHLFQLDKLNPAPYVLLSNIYADLGRWDGVSAVRRLMIDRGIVKDRGYSWIDNKESVNAFMVADDVRTVDNLSEQSNHWVCQL